jgi:hypothetical protein
MRDTTIIDERSSNERLNRQNTMMFADSSFRGIAGTHMMSAETNIDLFNGGQDILIQNSNDFAQAMEKIHTAGNNWLQTVAPSRMSRTTASAFIDAAKELNNSAAVMFNAHNISRYDRISEMNKIAGGGFYVWNTPDEINNSRPVRGYGITYISPNIDTSKMIMRDGLYQP